MTPIRLTSAQALVRFLAAQYVERDGVERRFFGGCFGIFGHGNVAGLGEALYAGRELLNYYPARNEQGMVHAAVGFARMRNRLGTLACTSSIGPGATNMITGAALATVNRLPVLLLPGDVFATRRPDPVLQQLETPWRGDLSVNDCFAPVSRYFDRIWRPEQLVPAALNAMRVLTSQSETGAVTLAFPQDVQAEAWDYPGDFFRKRVWRVPRPLPAAGLIEEATRIIGASSRPLIVAGGGVVYSEASDALRRLAERTGIPVVETQAGKGSLPFDHPSCLGAVGVTGTLAANETAQEADVVLGVGTRWTDFTTASKTAFGAPDVRFVNVNVAEFDAAKHAGLMLVGDARATLELVAESLAGWSVPRDYRSTVARRHKAWQAEVDRLSTLGLRPRPAQSEVIAAVNAASGPSDVVVCAAGSLPGDLHKLWRTRDPKGYQVEYGYSCMGYEIAGGLGVKLAAPEREVYVLVGDGSYLMLSSELATAVQEGVKLVVVLVDNQGYGSIGSLSRALGTRGFGTHHRLRREGALALDGDDPLPPALPLDLGANAESLGVRVIRASTIAEVSEALEEAKRSTTTVVVAVEVDRFASVPSYASWWDVPVAERSDVAEVRAVREVYSDALRRERSHL